MNHQNDLSHTNPIQKQAKFRPLMMARLWPRSAYSQVMVIYDLTFYINVKQFVIFNHNNEILMTYIYQHFH